MFGGFLGMGFLGMGFQIDAKSTPSLITPSVLFFQAMMSIPGRTKEVLQYHGE